MSARARVPKLRVRVERATRARARRPVSSSRASVLPIGLLGLEWLDERVATPPPLLSEPPALLLHTCIGLIGLHGLERLGYEDGLYVGYDDGRLMVRVGSTESARLA